MEPGAPSLEQAIVARLRAGYPVADRRFDALLGARLAAQARLHFTPVRVALRAADFLTRGRPTEVADLGSGAGKFCLVGAASSPGRFTGLEVRPWLVAHARATAARLGLEASARFVEGDVRHAPLDAFGAFFVFNPFAERQAEPDEWLDEAPPALDAEGDALRLRERLAATPPGTRLAVYCGFGAPLPDGFTLVAREPIGTDGGVLELCVKG